MAGEVLERDEALDALEAAVEAAHLGEGTVVLVGGEAGIGKTRLMCEFIKTVRDRIEILACGCDDLTTPRALGPLREALRVDETADIFTTALERLSGPDPRVLLIEDAHWADDATLDVLGSSRRRSTRSWPRGCSPKRCRRWRRPRRPAWSRPARTSRSATSSRAGRWSRACPRCAGARSTRT